MDPQERLAELRAKKRIAELREKKRMVNAFSGEGSVFEDEVRAANLPKQDKVEKTLRTIADIGTFGAAPYISAGVETLADMASGDDVSYKAELLEQQLGQESASNVYGTAGKFARDVAMPARTLAARIGIPVVTGVLEEAGRVDPTTEEGLIDMAQAGGLNALGAGIFEGAGKGASKLISMGEGEKFIPQKELIERYLMSKKGRTPENLENVIKNKDILARYSQEGMENVEGRLGEQVKLFKNANKKVTGDAHKTDDLLILSDKIFTKKPSQEKFVEDVTKRLQTGDKSTAGLLELADDIDDAAQTYYNKITAGNPKAKLSNNQREYYSGLIELRNSVKNKVRSPEGAYGQADKAFSEFQDMKPNLRDIKDAEFRYKKSSDPALAIEDIKTPNVPYPNTRGVAASVANAAKRNVYQYGDELSEEIGKNAPDPQKILNLDGDFSQVIERRPWVDKAGGTMGRVGRALTNEVNRTIEPEESPIERFREIYNKVPSMGPYQEELENASREGKLPLVHFYYMKTDPAYRKLFESGQ